MPQEPTREGPIAVRHQGHVDVLKGGRLIHDEGGRTVEHVIEVSATNPDRCDAAHRAVISPGHQHGPNCGHPAAPHGDHIDYLADGRLQHPHGDHVDDHGPLSLA